MIELIGVSKVYGREASTVRALDGVSLQLNPGELTAVMGPSGSGKTTLLNIIGCLDSATSGDYFLDGRDVAKLDLRAKAALRNEVFGFVFQAFNLLPDKTVLDNVMIPFRYSRVPRRQWKSRTLAVLAQLGIEALALRYPDQLSGGQQQRVAIARALVNRPALVLADEPTGNLDTRNGHEVMQLLRLANRDMGQTLVLITHDERIARQANRVLTIEDGRIVDDQMHAEGNA